MYVLYTYWEYTSMQYFISKWNKSVAKQRIYWRSKNNDNSEKKVSCIQVSNDNLDFFHAVFNYFNE